MRPKPAGRTVVGFARASLPAFLLLVTPLVIFLQYQRYGLVRWEILVALGAMAAVSMAIGGLTLVMPAVGVLAMAGLITLFADIQLDEPGEKRLALLFIVMCGGLWVMRRHAGTIVSLMMATILLLSVVSPRPGTAAHASWEPAGSAPLPLILHVVLDEHIGIDGLPRDLVPHGLAGELEAFYVNRGFRVFGRAYSEYPSTLWSLSHLLNLAPGGYVDGLTAAGAQANMFRLLKNAYFHTLAEQGYSIRVHQPEYLDVCADAASNATCTTYGANALPALDALAIPIEERLRVVAGAYAARSELVGRAKRTYAALRERTVRAGVGLPAWDWERSTSAPLGSMPVWDALQRELARARPGQLFYAHVLMPHYPYMYDAGCTPRAPSAWLTRTGAPHEGVPPGHANSPESRAVRYRRYAEQLRCTARKVDGLLDAVPERLRRDAIVIVQGDHGSRISLVDPDTAAPATLTTSDYADQFSTLFAVRSPGVAPGHDDRAVAITCALRGLVANRFTSSPDLEACGPRTLYFWNDGRPLARPFRAFWPTSVARQAH